MVESTPGRSGHRHLLFPWLVLTPFSFPSEAENLTDLQDLLVSSEENKEEDEDEDQDRGLVHQIHRVLLQIWTTSWKKCEGILIADPTEACLALMTLNQDGSFKEPKHVTSMIAKFQYCMWLAFLKEIDARAADGGRPEIDEASTCDDLQPWFIEKTYSTFARLCSLQHVASSIVYDTVALPCIWWTDAKTWQTMAYKGHRISFSDLQKIFLDTEECLIATWESGVLRKLSIRIEYADVDIADDLTNKNVRYSFLSDSRNECFQNLTRLIEAAVDGQGGFAGFLLPREGCLVWNQAALRRWLQDYADLQRVLLLRAEMLSGSPSRGTELTAMLLCNTQMRSTRNLVVLGCHVSLLCQYNKTSAITGREKLLPHGLDAVMSDVLIQSLVLARPLAQIAAKICFQDGGIDGFYRDHLFVNFDRLFTSEDLSAVMTRFSLPHVHFPLTINLWRHIQTAWKRKFGCSTNNLMEKDAKDNVEALQAGHSRATENRIYGLSTQSLASAGEDILPLFLRASDSWQRQCHVIPGGACLPYSQARSSNFPWKEGSSRTSGRPWIHSTLSQEEEIDRIVDRLLDRLAPMLERAVVRIIQRSG